MKAPQAPLLVAAVALSGLAGCIDARRVSRENDRLRAEVLGLKDHVDQLTWHVKELQAQLSQTADVSALPPEVRASTPRVAEISVGWLSHAADEDGDGRPETLVLYVEPADGLGRFLQMVGSLSAHAAVLPPDRDAITIGRVTLGPQELRGAYRSSFLGTNYSVTVPISVPEGLEKGDCIVEVEYVDGYTNQRHEATKVIDLTRRRPPGPPSGPGPPDAGG